MSRGRWFVVLLIVAALAGCTPDGKTPAVTASTEAAPGMVAIPTPAPSQAPVSCDSVPPKGTTYVILKINVTVNPDGSHVPGAQTLLRESDGTEMSDDSGAISYVATNRPELQIAWTFGKGVTGAGGYAILRSDHRIELDPASGRYTAPSGEEITYAIICGSRPYTGGA